MHLFILSLTIPQRRRPVWTLVHMSAVLPEDEKILVSDALQDAFYQSIDITLPAHISEHCQHSHLKEVKTWLGNGGRINATDAYGATLLHIACRIRHEEAGVAEEIVEMLIRRGADVNQKQRYKGGQTPLMDACQHGNKNIVLRLMGAGADSTAKHKIKQLTAEGLARKKLTEYETGNDEEKKKPFEEVIEAVGGRLADPIVSSAELDEVKKKDILCGIQDTKLWTYPTLKQLSMKPANRQRESTMERALVDDQPDTKAYITSASTDASHALSGSGGKFMVLKIDADEDAAKITGISLSLSDITPGPYGPYTVRFVGRQILRWFITPTGDGGADASNMEALASGESRWHFTNWRGSCKLEVDFRPSSEKSLCIEWFSENQFKHFPLNDLKVRY